MIYILTSFITLVAVMLYRRYFPVRSVPCVHQHIQTTKDVIILDIRDYNDEGIDNDGTMQIPYAYLPRYYNEIPKQPIHVVARNKLDCNLCLRFLTKKGFKVQSYSLTECPCNSKETIYPYSA
ncbi:sulfurtransferase [Bacillus sp. 165]|uniref:sulfurtransferase n=1 Tax=Bacillus sp. 165 TaxID=1529117 RepID=UPI001ADB476B|nr:sulfurtransferase [Bacillus sp. 165]MBO9130229.1 sulfurtransferase [Bacillus sp. 165]